MVVGSGADAAEAEYNIARAEARAQRCSEALGIVAEVVRPGEPQPSLTEGRDQEGEMFVLALTDEKLVADDIRAEQSYAAFFAQRWRSSSPPMCLPLTNTCGTVPRPVIAPTMRERSLWS